MARESSSDVSWTSLAVLLLVAIGIFNRSVTFQSARPDAVAIPVTATNRVQRVPARLWEDPLRAISYAPAQMSVGVRALASDVQTRIDSRTSGDVLLMPVLMPGQPFADESENRLRLRYAVIAALSAANYVPVHPGRIGFFRQPPVETPDQTEGQDEASEVADESDEVASRRWLSRGRIGFEWFDRARNDTETTFASVLLLWVNETGLGSRPCSQIFSTLTELLKDHAGALQVRVLGPTSTDAARVFLADSGLSNEAEKYQAIRRFLTVTGAEFISPWVTIEPDNLNRISESEYTSNQLRTKDTEIPLRQISVRDSRVIQKLCRELDVRGVLDDGETVIFYEQDTIYGRNLAAQFEEILAERFRDRPAGDVPLRFLGFYQGVDGTLFSGNDAADQATDEPKGSSQLDYIRRTHDIVSAQDDRPITAIGILGSSVYDKLLLLQALAHDHDSALFFTTDLDARFGHPTESHLTRNLLVASSFGLEPQPYIGRRRASLDDPGALVEDAEAEKEQSAPPLRDSYQTASYLACSMALGFDVTHGDEAEPLLFEIGRSGPVALGTPDDPSHHEDQAADSTLSIGAAVLAVALLLLGVCIARRLQRPWRQRSAFLFGRRTLDAVDCGVVVVAALLATAIASSAWLENPEPFELFSGVSLWPTQAIRVVALGLCAYYILMVISSMIRDERAIARTFGLAVPHSGASTALRPKSTPSRARRRAFYGVTLLAAAAAPALTASPLCADTVVRLVVPGVVLTLAALSVWWVERVRSRGQRLMSERWERFCDDGDVRRRLWMTAGYAVVAVSAAASMQIALGGRPIPGRDAFSRAFDVALVAPLTFSTFWLVALVVHAHLRAHRLLRGLSERSLLWDRDPSPTQEERELDPIGKRARDEWKEIQLAGEVTQWVGRLITFPILVLFVVILARFPVFDDWGWDARFLIPYGLTIVLLGFVGIQLRTYAEAARRHTLDVFEEERRSLVAKLAPAPDIDLLDQLRASVESYHLGAFAQLHHNPVFRAIVLPSSGVGLLAFFQQFIIGG